MPNRIIKESICTSENVDQLTEFQEVFFYRLMVNCDDFGRFDARPKLVSSRLFPLRDISTEKVVETLNALRAADLIILYEVGGHPYLQMKTWGKHQQARATKSRYPSPEDVKMNETDGICNQMISDDINGNQPQETDIKNHRIRNRIRNTVIDNRNRESRAEDDADADETKRIAADHNRVLDAAEDAGFQRSNSVRAKLIDLYAEHGLEKVLAGISSCVQHGAVNLAYLEACMKGGPKKKPSKPPLPAQDYEQRDYSGEDEAALDRLINLAKERGKSAG